jgi:hypothetical protein
MSLTDNLGGLITGGVGAFTGNPALMAAGAASLFGPSASDIAGQQAAGSAYRGVDINTGMGSATFDQDTGYTSQLSPELMAIRDQLFGRVPEGLQQFQTFDPTQAGALFTQRLDELAAPKEEANRLSLENRLFKQGLLSSTTGDDRRQALLEAQALAQGQRDLTGVQLGQDQQTRLFNQAMGFLNSGMNVADIERQLIAMSQGQAGAATQAAGNQAGMIAQGRADDAATQQGFFNNLISGLPETGVWGSDNMSGIGGVTGGSAQDTMLAQQNFGLF